jgi:hypothetical protein
MEESVNDEENIALRIFCLFYFPYFSNSFSDKNVTPHIVQKNGPFVSDLQAEQVPPTLSAFSASRALWTIFDRSGSEISGLSKDGSAINLSRLAASGSPDPLCGVSMFGSPNDIALLVK